ATRQHIDEVLAAAADVDALADTARERAATVARGVLLGTAAVAVATAASLWVVRRAIVSPLRDLAVATDALRRGGDLHHVPLRGPSEVRTAAAALNEATDGLRRVEEQALALADGRLADPSLGATVSGPLGASVSLAVDRLRGSLAEQEVFRRRLAHEATHDALTGLPNRAASLDHLRAALARVQRADTNLAVLFVDLDRFKSVNDRDGHAAGDAVLREVARRLAEGCRGGDVVGRLGGDEFLVIAESVADAAGARQLADRLVDSLLAGRPATIGASIGIAVSRPDISADELVHAADVALYRAKSAGGHRSELHGPDPTTVGDDRAPAI
ncbi:MAG TPA: sensor domain-containing diguanylate cyclase, partial [Acidimicrobiales bacterium]|nr:sensor domain-containing diguanylate cyclase [Acidimicrobiales bacterium]